MFRVFGVEQGNILKSLIFSCVEMFLSTVYLLNYFLSRCVYSDPQLGVSDFFLALIILRR